jgi:crotonobetainyl-CoA:carnitine CoA-transferase CaiB-like acyl-CoA transferase
LADLGPPSAVLRGIRVVDFGHFVAGPLAALLLADQGAAVIHVDRLGGGYSSDADPLLLRGKRRRMLDLKTERDLGEARRLIGDADIVIENFRPGVMDRLGLGWDAVGHDRLVYCSLPGFAADDDRAGMPGWEGAIAAATGTYSGDPEATHGLEQQASHAGPRFTALPLASTYAAAAAAVAITMALIARERDGYGQRVEVPLFDAMFLAFGASGLLVDGRAGGARPADPWSGDFVCKDGETVHLSLATPRFVGRFLAACDVLDDWAASGFTDPGLVKDEHLWARQHQALTDLFATRTATEWDEFASEITLPLTRAQASEAWLNSPHAREAGIAVGGEGGTLVPGPALRVQVPQDDGGDPRARIIPSVTASNGDATLRAALDGFRVIDTTQVLAGPTAARTLAEFGAEVIKINNPHEEGAGYRWQVHRYHTDVNRGKHTILLDLKRSEGMDILWDLVKTADVFAQNLRLGVAERLGFGYADTRKRNPDIVYLSISAFGYGGEWECRPGYEPNAQAITGMQMRMGGAGAPPLLQPFAVNDYCTGLLGALGMGLGVLHRLRTGNGAHVQTSLGHAATYLQSPYLVIGDGRTNEPPGGQHARGWQPLQRLYRAADEWFFLGAVDTQRERLADVPGLETTRGFDGDGLEARLEAAFAKRRAAEWVELLVGAGLGAHVLVDVADLMRDPWAIRHGLSVTRPDALGAAITTTGPPQRLSRLPVVPGRLAPAPGSDAAHVLALIGRESHLDDLVELGIISLT